MRQKLIISFLSVLSAITIHLPDQISAFRRCPEHGSTDLPIVKAYPDENFCNVYHQCNCTRSACQIVESQVCPNAKVYSKTTETCLDIEEESCATMYVQWVQTHSSNTEAASTISDSLLPSTASKDFQCEQDQQGKFSDPNICNIFHVCITRNNITVDQPFMCPYPTVFKTGSSGKMFCAHPEVNDCKGKAFYRSLEGLTTNSNNNDSLNYQLPKNTLMLEKCERVGLYADSLYCNAYHKCTSDGEDEQYLCENQLLFNPQSNICDYPINVVCGGKGLLRRPSGFANGTLVNSSYIMVYGVELRPECPSDVSNILIGDQSYCNVFYHCQSGRGSVYICREGTVFDTSNKQSVGTCRSEELVNCSSRLILTSQGQRPAIISKISSKLNSFGTQSTEKPSLGKSLPSKSSNFILLPAPPPPPPPSTQSQKVIVNVAFDCKGRIDGHWRDARYCDIFHACIAGEQKRSYGCTQIGERFYFDDVTQKCEFTSRNSNGCPTSQYYTSIEPVPGVPGGQLVTEAPTEPWKMFIQSREQFTCTGKQDGFYASRWCNVFYRCYIGVQSAFLCPKMPSGARLWWVQHGSPQGVAQETAACTWPCETGRRCSSSGGIIVDSGSTVSESQQEADAVFSKSLCTSSSSSSANGDRNSGSAPQPSVPGGSSSSTADVSGTFTADSDVSCIGQVDGVFLSSRYCNVFHRCVSGTRRDFRCSRATNTPYDLWWNQQTQQCDWPCRIQCTGSVFGTPTSAQQVRSENALLFSNECAGYQVNVNNNPAIVYSSLPQEPSQTSRALTSRLIENPDPNFLCIVTGKYPSRRYCNVFYECSDVNVPPSQTYECVDGFFDRSQSACLSKDQVPCLGGIYPYDSSPIDRNPDSLQCSTNTGFQLHTSKQFCNIYYLCDGTQPMPTTFRCFDRRTQEEGIYDPFAERCDSRRNSNCQNSILNLSQTQSYRALPIDHTRLPDLAMLPCNDDQSYVLEHEQYCNLYHVCKRGDYHLYACISDNSENNQPTSYFYQANGQCTAPLSTLCPKTKSVMNYERLLSTATSEVFQPLLMSEQQQQQQQQYNYGSIPIQERLEPTPKCRASDNYIIAHERYCNLFYGCKEGELILYACVDRLTNTYAGVFQSSTGNCIASSECATNEFFRPNPVTTLRPNSNTLFRSYTMLEVSNETRKLNETMEIKSPFSCFNRLNGYYESEWCNIFYRCTNGKRVDERCPIAGTQSSTNYDLWWRHQYRTYNSSNPQYFGGLDYMVRCDWPCKVPCQKPIWISKDNILGSADHVLKQDHEQRPGCALVTNKKIEHSMQIPQQMIMYSDIPNPSNYSCPLGLSGIKIRLADPKYCNVFHECTHSKLVGSYLCIESQFDSKENDCILLSMNENCPVERRYSYSRSRFAAQSSLAAYYEAVEVRSVNPSGYECITDGIHTDPMFCNLFHACSGRTRRTFQCRQTGTDGINEGVSTFDLNTKSCTRFSSYSCPSLLYNQEFFILPVMFKPPAVSPCGKEGFFSVSDVTAQYCTMFAWCSKGHGEPKVFECVPTTAGSHQGAFDISRRSCSARTTCPHARQSSPFNTSLLAMTVRPKVISIGNRKQFSLTSTMLENGYIALGSDFQTTFTCPLATAGFFSNPNYCDVFHYCYETGELSSYVCASMPNRYQLWWSHQNEQGRADNVFCDWPCNLQGVYTCPAHKTILMRDRQAVSNVAQREVLEATCSSAQVPAAIPIVVNTIAPEPVGIVNPVYNPPVPPQQPSSVASSVLGYQPCAPSNDWFVSQSTIRCSPSFAATGFAPDPKDCSKYYACDSFVGNDGMASGVLMQCLAGLWWDQQRRTCVLPSEVACNPYNIINSQGQNTIVNNNPNVVYQPIVPPSVPITIISATPNVVVSPIQPSVPGVSGSGGPNCRGMPLCTEVGLNILQQMKGIPGRSGWFYKCDSQCALEMRCPPGLVFDDLYQRCEWPGAGAQAATRHLGSLRDKKGSLKNQTRQMTTQKQSNPTISSTKQTNEPKYLSSNHCSMELTRRKSQNDKINEEDSSRMMKSSDRKRKNSSDRLRIETTDLFSYIRKLCFDQTSSSTYFYTRILFIRLLGLVYTFSFLAAFHQAPVLIGHQGLYPSYLHMNRMKERYGVWQSPSIFYFLPAMDTSDFSLRTVCALGTLLGMFLLFTGRCNSILLFILWSFHTSLLNIGQLFYGYGWETQILETTFLGMFLVPFYSLAKINRSSPPSILFIFLMRFLIARIMLGAGLIKIRGDQCWKDLTCMNYHYETQPIPNPISYYLHQSPAVFHKFEVLVNHVVELIVPFLCFGPWHFVRHLGGTVQILFQILLIISGNLSVLNWITIGPALWCLDDSYPLYKYIFKRRTIFTNETVRERMKSLRSIIQLIVFGLIIYLSIDPVINLFSRHQRMNSSFDRLNLVNTYGAFGSVGKIRDEVIIKGCNRSTVEQCDTDQAWLEYQFSCKPGRIDRAPCFSAPYHRRLTWQLWFAAMQNIQYNPWLIHLMVHLLASDRYSPVNVVLTENPFPNAPPRFIKADSYRYSFTRLARGEKNWWTRSNPQAYSPVFELNSSQLKSILRQMGWKMPKVPMRS